MSTEDAINENAEILLALAKDVRVLCNKAGVEPQFPPSMTVATIKTEAQALPVLRG